MKKDEKFFQIRNSKAVNISICNVGMKDIWLVSICGDANDDNASRGAAADEAVC